jgi:hypothetical protein
MTVLRFLRVTVLAAFVGCGHAPSEPASPRSERASPPSDGVPTAGSVNAGVASAGPVEPVSATVEVPEPVHENALYLGSADGPIVRIAEDGTVTSLGPEARTTHLALGLDGVVYAASSRQVVAVVGDALESVGGVGPMNFTMVAARSRDDVWAAAAGGVAHFDGHAWTTVDEPFAGQVVRDLAFDSAGVLWVLTRNAIYRHVDGSFEELPAMTGSTLLTGFVPNASGGLDVYNYRGVDRYDGQAWSMVPINWVERSHEGRLAMTTLGHAAFGGGVLALSGGHDAGICLKVPEVQYFGSTSMAELQLPASRVTDVAVDGAGGDLGTPPTVASCSSSDSEVHASRGGGPSTGSPRSCARLRNFSSWETVRPRCQRSESPSRAESGAHSARATRTRRFGCAPAFDAEVPTWSAR